MAEQRRAIGPDGKVWTQGEVEQEIIRIEEQLVEWGEGLEAEAKRVAELEVDWKKNRARTRMMERVKPGTGPGGRTTNDEVDDIALNKHADKYEAYTIAEAAFGARKDAIFTLRDAGGLLQTIAANLRAQT